MSLQVLLYNGYRVVSLVVVSLVSCFVRESFRPRSFCPGSFRSCLHYIIHDLDIFKRRENVYFKKTSIHKNITKIQGRRTNYFDFQFSLPSYVNNTSQLTMSSTEVIKVRLSV